MAIQLRQRVTGWNVFTPANFLTFTPGGFPFMIQNNDLILAFLSMASTTATVTPPAGFTAVTSQIGCSTATLSGRLYSKIASNETATYTWNFSANVSCMVTLFVASGLGTITTGNTSSLDFGTGAASFTGLVTPMSGEWEVYWVTCLNTTQVVTFTNNQTEHKDDCGLGNPGVTSWQAASLASTNGPVGGGTGDCTFTPSVAYAGAVGISVGVRPNPVSPNPGGRTVIL